MADQSPSSPENETLQNNDPLVESIVDILDAAQNLMQLSQEHKENDDAGGGVSRSKKKKKRISGEEEVDQTLIDFKVMTARRVKRVKKYRSLAEIYEVTTPIDAEN